MKPGFGNNSKKRKQKRKGKAGKGGDGDEGMTDAAPTAAAPSPEPMTDAVPSAKEKQQQRMALKKALKVQVANLKSKRNKLTKLAGNRNERRQLNTELKGLVQEQISQKQGSQQQAAGAAPAAEDQMAD